MTLRNIVETTRPHFSFSQLWTFLSCSMRYYFRYVLGLPEPHKLDLSRGSAGHLALELNARHKITNRVDQTAEQMIDNFVTAFDKELADFEPGDLDLDENPDKTKDHTIEVIRTYRLDPKKGAAAVRPEAVELDFTMEIPPTEEFPDEIKPITGKIDQIGTRKRVVIPNGRAVTRTEIIDYKFPGRKPSNMQDKADMSDQLTMYDMVLTNAGKPTKDLGFIHMVPQTKTLPPRIEPAYRSPLLMTPAMRENRHERLRYKLRQAIRQIKAGIFNPVDDPRTCAICPYRKMCQFSLAKDDYTALLLKGRHIA